MNLEAKSNQETLKQSAINEVKDIAADFSKTEKWNKTGEELREKRKKFKENKEENKDNKKNMNTEQKDQTKKWNEYKEVTPEESQRNLEDFQQKNKISKTEEKDKPTEKDIIMNAMRNALDKPKDIQMVKNMQSTLGYGDIDGKNFYNPEPGHMEHMKKTLEQNNKTPDGSVGPFTLWAMNTAIIDPTGLQLKEMKYPNPNMENIKVDDGKAKEWILKFIGTLHPKFYDAFKDKDPNNFTENEKIIVETMQKIQKGEVKKEDIQNMQWALKEFYPSTHESKKDGIPGQNTQVALQNFAFKKLNIG